jgi:hypothetical protein
MDVLPWQSLDSVCFLVSARQFPSPGARLELFFLLCSWLTPLAPELLTQIDSQGN